MSKSPTRQSLAERLAAVAGPPAKPAAILEAEAKPLPALKVQAPKPKGAMPVPETVPTPSTVAKARDGKTMIAGYFSPQMAKAVRLLAVERDMTVQALVGEGLDMVLHKHGKHPMGER